MRVKLSDVLNANRALQNLGGVKLPAKGAWRVAMIAKKITPIVETFEATRSEIAIRYGATESAPVPSERMAEFVEELNELVKEEEAIDVVRLRLSDLGDALIAPADLAALEFLIDGDA
jgi:hypothetical protein